MLWHNDAAVPLPVEDAEELMEFRRGYTASSRPPKGDARRTARRHALGNTIHVPSVVLLISLLMVPAARAADSSRKKVAPNKGTAASGADDSAAKPGRPRMPSAQFGTRQSSTRGPVGPRRTNLTKRCPCCHRIYLTTLRSPKGRLGALAPPLGR